MKTFGFVMLGILAIVILIALAFVLELGGLRWQEYFAPKREAVRRKVFKETRSFNEAKLQELSKLRFEYIKEKDQTTKEALKFMIRHNFADYDEERLPPEMKKFLHKIKYTN